MGTFRVPDYTTLTKSVFYGSQLSISLRPHYLFLTANYERQLVPLAVYLLTVGLPPYQCQPASTMPTILVILPLT